MHNKALAPLLFGSALLILSFAAFSAEENKPNPARWSWQEPYAQVDPKGDIAWKPRPFVFEKGGSARYIDFDAGDDTNPGDNSAAPWKHHPWDPQAAGKSAQASGVHTYVFK